MRRLCIGLLSILLLFMLSACQKAAQEALPNDPSAEEVQEPQEEAQEEPHEESNGNDDVLIPATEESLPQTLSIKLLLEGMEETRTATLNESYHGFYVYLFDGYTLDDNVSGKSNKSTIVMNYDPTFYADVEVLPQGIDHNALKQDIQTELAAFGEIDNEDATNHMYEQINDLYHYSVARDNVKGSTHILVRQLDEERLVKINVRIPIKEAIEGFSGVIWEMINTLQLNGE